MTTFQQYNVYDGLTAVKLVSIGNVGGTYYNGLSNNGVGATYTCDPTVVIDGVTVALGDRVLLKGQTAQNQNGIYIATTVEANTIFTRAPDFQSIEQIRAGQFVTVQSGVPNAGTIYTVVSPLPGILGIDNLLFNSSVVSSVTTTAGGIATFTANGTLTQNSSFVRAQKHSNAGGSSLVDIGDANISASSIIFAQIESSANAVSIQKVTPLSGNFLVLMSGDPGASVISYFAVRAQ